MPCGRTISDFANSTTPASFWTAGGEGGGGAIPATFCAGAGGSATRGLRGRTVVGVSPVRGCRAALSGTTADGGLRTVALQDLYSPQNTCFGCGPANDKGLRINPKTLQLEVMKLGENGVTVEDVIVHDETNSTLAFMLARMPYPEFPVALGVLFAETRPTYDGVVAEQQASTVKKLGKGNLQKLLNSGSTWEI